MKTFSQFLTEADDARIMKDVLHNLTVEEQKFVIDVLRKLAPPPTRSGNVITGHPYPDGQTIKFFRVTYVKELIRKAIPLVTSEYTAALWTILKKIK